MSQLSYIKAQIDKAVENDPSLLDKNAYLVRHDEMLAIAVHPTGQIIANVMADPSVD